MSARLSVLILTLLLPLLPAQGGVSGRPPMDGLLAEVVFASSVVPKRVRDFRDKILEFGDRAPGSPGAAACAEWVAQRLRTYGLAVTEGEATDRSQRAASSFVCQLSGPPGARSRSLPLAAAAVIQERSLPRRRLGLRRPRAAGRRVESHAVWIERDLGEGRLVLEPEELTAWRRAGAQAVVVAWTTPDPADDPAGVPLCVSLAGEAASPLPVFALAPSATRAVRARMDGEQEPRLVLGVDVEERKGRVRDLWGIVDGVAAERPIILVSAHLAPEGHGPDATGAGGLAVLLEMAHDLGLSRKTTEFTPLGPAVLFLVLADRARGLDRWLAEHPRIAERVQVNLQLERLGAFSRDGTIYIDTLAPDRRARPFVRGLTALEFYCGRKGFWTTVEVVGGTKDAAWPPYPWRRRPLTESPGIVLSTDPMDPAWMRDAALGSGEADPGAETLVRPGRRLLTTGDVPTSGDHVALVSAARAGLVLLRRLGTEEVR